MGTPALREGVPEIGRVIVGSQSAVATPQATFGGEFLHGSIPAMAAAYRFHLCQNHAFIDGNKRVGANAAITFLFMNDWRLVFDADELTDLVLSVAAGRTTKQQLMAIFEKCCEWQASTQITYSTGGSGRSNGSNNEFQRAGSRTT